MQLGHEVVVFELAGSNRLPYEVNGVKVLSPVFDPLGNDIVIDYARQAKADAVITLMDVWRFDPNVWSQVPFYPHTPIDHTPVPPAVMSALSAAPQVIAMSQFGVNELKKAGRNALYAPLAYDPEVWKPLDKQACREKLSIEGDEFRVTFIGVNDSVPSRKGIPELLSAWQIFSSKYPQARLYLHTGVNGNLPVNGVIGGVQIDVLMATLGLNPESIRMVDQYEYRTGIKTERLVEMVNASDVLILPSRGEGFGLPLLEAQACGVPVITTRCAAGEELLKAGWFVEGESEWGYQGAFVTRPGILSIVEGLEAAFEQRNNPVLRQLAIEGVMEYEIDSVVSRYWKPVLQALAESTLERLQVKEA